jgi:hypothetical protein
MTGSQLPLTVSNTPLDKTYQDKQAVAACQQGASWQAGSCPCLSAKRLMTGRQLPLPVSKTHQDRQAVASAVSKTPHHRQAVAFACQQDASSQADSCLCLSADASGKADSCLCLSARRLMTGRQLPLPVSKTHHEKQAVVFDCQHDVSWQAGSCLSL